MSYNDGSSSSASAISLAPSVQSSFGRLYHTYPADYNEDAQEYPLDPPDMPVITHMNTYDPSLPQHAPTQFLILHYMRTVLPIQYLLSDSSHIRSFIYDLIRTSNPARLAACMLAAIHLDRMRLPRVGDAAGLPASELYKLLWRDLAQKTESHAQLNEGDAMAGLHAVSTILFMGGRGEWENFLNVARQYVWNVLYNQPGYTGPEQVLLTCSESTRFIIKTTMWFDVLASVTTQQIPTLMRVYRDLFDRTGRAYIEDPAQASPPELSMLAVMGCENNIVLALAEISNLACWKELQARSHCLSVPQLVARGKDIESKFINPGGPSSPSVLAGANGLPSTATAFGLDPHAAFAQGGYDGAAYGPGPAHAAMAMAGAVTEVEERRRLTNDIFRASARVYLHTVLSGDYPGCDEIAAAVKETIECLQRVPRHKALVSRAVLRSVVFGICISGCLTDNREQREFLIQLLETQTRESVGNIEEVKRLMQQVWMRRAAPGNQGQPVNWRDVMREMQREMLLLV
jgi:C6 transcription factor Pro1